MKNSHENNIHKWTNNVLTSISNSNYLKNMETLNFKDVNFYYSEKVELLQIKSVY